MKLAIMQPYFFPYIGYFQLINEVDEFIIYDEVNFIKKGWINKNNILINGKSYSIRVPLREKSSFKKISEVEIQDNDNWRKKMLLDLYVNYKRAKYFNDVYPILEKVINYPTIKISELNFQSIKSVCNYLGIKTKISNDISRFSDLEYKLSSDSINEKLFPNIKLNYFERKVIRILEICRIKDGTTYINPIGGTCLYEKEDFLANGVELKFVKTKEIFYQQFDNDFAAFLSIIDVLMFNSIDEVNELLGKYELI